MKDISGKCRRDLWYVLSAAFFVYVVSHWSAISSPYVINDDVRQQIFWMQQWQEPGLYQGDVLARYARNYVSWGVQAIYWPASHFMNPVQFTKVLAGLLYVLTAGLLYSLARGMFRDRLTPLLAVCVYFLFGGFMMKISGGLPQSFAYPLLIGYLLFLARQRLVAAGGVILLQSVFNPYIFLLCLLTHALYIAHNHGGLIGNRILRPQAATGAQRKQFNRLFLANLTVGAGIVLMALKYVFFKSQEFGNLVTRAEMKGLAEYSAAGRYELLPQPSFFYELIRPWIFNLPFREWGLTAGLFGVVLVVALVGFAVTRRWKDIDITDFRVFAYLFVASLILYLFANFFLLKLFVPRRYLQFSLNLFYCLALATCLRITIEELRLKHLAFPLLTTLFILFAAFRLQGVGIYDYSAQAPLYRFMATTPIDSLVAGHPGLMDNVLTFSRRRAFVTYELSHAWIQPYWSMIKDRTSAFFKAYYAAEPDDVREFCRNNSIDYLIVREQDFRILPDKERYYFEPFNSEIRKILGSKNNFAVLDEEQFPSVYRAGGVRVIKLY
ncbi:MAG: hypothetical protein L3J03_04010 [Desulfobacterales bacterium]|nr:hypothetical protein [Desulfobacterales bacterium]